MSKQRLFDLVHAMQPSERRYFKQYLKRHSEHSQDTIYARFFDYLAKNQKYDKAHLLRKCPFIKAEQLQNIQSRLFNHILESLRAFHAKSSFTIRLSELMINAEILERKAMFSQSLKFLEKAEKLAKENERNIELEQILIQQEALIMKRSKSQNHKEQISEVQTKIKEVNIAQIRQKEITDMQSHIYDVFREVGRFARDASTIRPLEIRIVKFNASFKINPDSFIEKFKYHSEVASIYRFGGHLDSTIKHLHIVRSLFNDNPSYKVIHETHYTRFLTYYIIACNVTGRFEESLSSIALLRSLDDEDSESKRLYKFENCFFFELEAHLLQLQFGKAVAYFEEHQDELVSFEKDLHSVNAQSKLYRIALAYFGNGQFKSALKWINRILNNDTLHYRKDMQVSVRLLNILIHYKLSNFSLLENRLKTTTLFIKKIDRWLPSEKAFILAFNAIVISGKDEKETFQTLLIKLDEAEKSNKLERYFFNYFDPKQWIKSELKS